MKRFVPPYPHRPAQPVATWRGFFGERARTSVYGWSERAFEIDYLKRNILGFRVHVLLDPDLIEHVLLGNAANYVKPDIVKGLLGPIIGKGLLTSDGSLWREQRKIVAASFSPTAVEAQRAMFVRAAREAMAGWDESRRDMAPEATRTTMTVIALALFGGDRRLISETSMAHIAAAIEGFSEARMLALLRLPQFPLTSKGRAGRQGQLFLRRTLEEVVDDRWHGRVAGDFLTGMIDALRQRFPDEEARALSVDNAATFYLAGHETTANAITWTLFLLAAQPELQEELAAEAAAAGEGEDQVADRVPRLRLFLTESMRLYPPVPRFDRQAVAADHIGQHQVEPGDIVSIWPWMLHRHRKYWTDPDAFDSERFAGKGGRHRFQYLPFGAGPRTCVGAQFATAEALTILAHWLRQWRFREAGHEVRPAGMVTLRPAGGLPLRLERR